MGALHISRDLIEVQEEIHSQQYIQEVETYSSPYGQNIATDALSHGAIDMSFQQQENKTMTNVKRFLYSQEQQNMFNALPSWQNEYSGFNEQNCAPRILGQYDVALSPWPRNQTIPRELSPDGNWIGGRSTVEQESSSGSSAWSDRTSEGRPEYDANPGYGFAWNSQRGSIACQFDAGFSPIVRPDTSFNDSNSSSCIALRDVQEYPDADPDDAYRKSENHELDSATPYFIDVPAPYQARTGSIHYLQDDEGIGSSIHDSIASLTKEDAEENDAVMEDSSKDDGNDSDVSSYIPPASTRRASTRRTTRTKPITTPPTTTKRPSRSKNT